MPFQLLCAIARGREKGRSNIDLNRETGQDSRSLTGRVNTLQNHKLVKKYPIVEKSSWTYLNVYWKFIDSNRENTEMVTGTDSYDITNLRSTIMSLLKNAENGIRQLCDIKAELGSSSSIRTNATISSSIHKLAQQGYLERIYVYRPEAPERKYYCLRFLKDLPLDDDYEVEEDEDASGDFSDGEEAVNDKVDSNDIKDISTMNIVKPDSKQTSRVGALQNIYFPLESQIFDMIEASGVEGIPGVGIIYKLTGGQYAKIVTRVFNLFSSLPQSKMTKYTEKPLGYLVIIRGTDFSARVKFYRYFTSKYYAEFSSKPCLDIWGEFQNIAQEFKTLSLMEEKSIVPITSHVPEGFKSGLEKTLSEVKKLPIIVERRGRPRKNPLLVDTNAIKVETRGRKKGSKNHPKKTAINTSKDVPKVGDFSAKAAESTVASNSMVTKPDTASNTKILKPEIISDTVMTESESPKNSTKKKRLRQITLFETAVKRPRTRSSYLSNQSSPENSLIKELPIVSSVDTVQPEAPESTSIDSHAVMANLVNTEPTSKISNETNSDSAIESISSTSETHINDDSELTIDPDILKTEAEVTKAIKEATKHLVNPDSEISSNGINVSTNAILNSGAFKRTKKKPDSHNVKEQNISIVLVKRINQIQTLLRENNGVMQGGIKLANNLNERFNKENNGDMDKKTVVNALNHLEKINEIWQVHFESPHPKTGVVTKRSLVFHHTIAKDSDLIDAKKKELFNEVRKGSSAPQLRVAKFDFKVYTKKMIAIEKERAAFKERKKKERDAKKAKSVQRLGEKDKELRRKKSGQRPKTIPEFIKDGKHRKPRKPMESSGVNKKSVEDSSTGPIGSKVADRRKPKGNDPLLSLPIESKDLPNSKRLSHMRDENAIVSRKSFKFGTKRSPIPISSDMFFRIAVISRSLGSDGHNNINWTQVSNCMPGITPTHAKSAWPRVRDRYGDSTKIDLIQKVWEKIFLQAYEDGELPIFDKDEYDLTYLARFWMRKFPRIHEQADVPLLFDSREANESKYTFHMSGNSQRYNVFYNSPSRAKCFSDLIHHSFAYEKHTQPILESELTNAKIGLKSIIATTNDSYNKQRANNILEQLGKEICAAATKEMDSEKSIVYVPTAIDEKFVPDRNFMFSEKFMSSLKTRLGPYWLFDVNLFYNELVSTLNEAKGYIMSRVPQDNSVISVLDLICYEKVDLVRVNAEQHTVIHSSRKVDRNVWECDIVVRTPLRYVNDSKKHQLTKLIRQNVSLIPLGEPSSTIWTDINGNLSKPIFRKLVQWLLLTIDARPGITLYGLHQKINLVLSKMEMELLLDWLIQLNCLRKGEISEGYWLIPEWYVNVMIS